MIRYPKLAQEKFFLFSKKDEINKQIASNKNALATAEKALQEATTNVHKAKTDLDQAVADLASKSKVQNERSIALEAKKKELTANQQKHSTQSGEFNKWNQRANQRSVQLSQIKESYRKASESQNENQDDSSYAEAVSKAKPIMLSSCQQLLHSIKKDGKYTFEYLPENCGKPAKHWKTKHAVTALKSAIGNSPTVGCHTTREMMQKHYPVQ